MQRFEATQGGGHATRTTGADDGAVIAPAMPGIDLRAAELERMLAILADRRPALVVLCGPSGSGKSTLLVDLGRRAVAHGWEVAGCGAGGPLTIGPRTREREVRDAVLMGTRDRACDDDHRESRARTLATARRSGEFTIGLHAGTSDPVVVELARRAPLLVLIDGYRPRPSLAAWFEHGFLSGVLACGEPVVVAVAQRPGDSQLETLATDVVELGHISTDQARAVLGEIAPLLDPPLSARELEAYAQEARTPLLLSSLVRVLALAARGARDAT